MSYPPGTPGDGDLPPQNPYAGSGDQSQQGPPPYGQQYPPPSYGQPPYGQQYPPPGYGQAPAPATNGKATAALITGISSLVLSWCCGLGIVGIVAIVLGVKARGEIRASGGRQNGDGMALGGIITGVIAVVLGLAVLAIIVIALANGDANFDTYDYNY